MKATLSERGQITIPKPCREKLGLRPGAVLDFDTQEGKLIAVKTSPEDRFRKWRGKGKLFPGLSVNGYLRKARG